MVNEEINKKIFYDLEKEFASAVNKFHNYHSFHEGYAVIKEELEELWDEIKVNGDKASMYSEIIQVMATCKRFIIDLILKEGYSNGKRN